MEPLGICEKCGEFEGRCTCGKGRIVLDGTKRERISKFLSGLLRHFPYSFGVEVDKEGWAELRRVSQVLVDKYGVEPSAIGLIVKFDPKGRFELRNGKIRARYGHTIDVKTDWGEISDAEVPPKLYHGTAPENLQSILERGLLPMKRKEVHLSESVEDALEVGRRYSKRPVVLEIDAKSLVKAGISMRKKGRIYTVSHVPPQFIKVYSSTDRTQREEKD